MLQKLKGFLRKYSFTQKTENSNKFDYLYILHLTNLLRLLNNFCIIYKIFDKYYENIKGFLRKYSVTLKNKYSFTY